MKLSIALTICITFVFFGCNQTPNSDKLNTQNSIDSSLIYHISDSLSTVLNNMISSNPDSVILITNEILNDYPNTAKILYIRIAAYFELKRYNECKSDIERFIEIRPEDKYALIGMIDYLDCKINTDGDCGDSILGNENVVTVTIDTNYNNEIVVEENNEKQIDSTILEFFTK